MKGFINATTSNGKDILIAVSEIIQVKEYPQKENTVRVDIKNGTNVHKEFIIGSVRLIEQAMENAG